MRFLIILSCVLINWQTAAIGISLEENRALNFSSGNDKVHLVELYSSQGCSSCPPAQAWINKMEKSAALWNKVIPIVFHVDYWDHLGW